MESPKWIGDELPDSEDIDFSKLKWTRCETCDDCVYGAGVHQRTCDYYLITGKRRPSSVAEVMRGNCSVKKQGIKKSEWTFVGIQYSTE